MRRRLQADLRALIKERRNAEVSVIRTLIAAIDNAGAVPLPPRSGAPPGEVERRRLSTDDVQAVLRRELEEREASVREFTRLGRAERAEQARIEADVVGRYIA